jgi:hypothetical protein
MAKKVLASDLVQENIFKNTIESADLLIAKLTEVNKEFKTTAEVTKEVLKSSRLDSVKSINDLTKATENATKLQKEQLKVEQELTKAIALREQAQLRLNKIEELNNTKIANEKLRGTIMQNKENDRQIALAERKAKADEREIANQTRLQSVYNRVNTSLNKLRNEYRDLAIRKELGAQLTSKEEFRYSVLEKRINTYDAALKKVDASMGNHQRNVGNYASGWNGLSNSVNQLTREMPAFANSVQTGFMAISNNLPMFFDELQKIKKSNVELKAQGLETKSALTQLGASIFSWGTALSVGVTLLTLYGAKLVDWASSLDFGNKKLKENQKLEEERQKQLSKTSEYVGKESASYVGLLMALKNTNQESKERSKWIKEINDKYGVTIQNLKDEKKFQEQLNTSIKDYIEYKKAEFKIKQNEDLIALNLAKQAKLTNELTRAQKEQREQRNEQLQAEIRYNLRVKQLQDQGIKDFNLSTVADQTGLAKFTALGDKISYLKRELADANKRLETYGFNIYNAKVWTDKYDTSATETIKTQKELNRYMSQYVDIVAQLLELENKRAENKLEDDFNKELEKQLKSIRETGEGSYKELESIIQAQAQLKKDALEEEMLANERAREFEYKQKLKDLERQRDNYKVGTKEYESFQQDIAELNADYDKKGVLKAEEYRDKLSEIDKNATEKDKKMREDLSNEYFAYKDKEREKSEDEEKKEQKRKEDFYNNLNKLAKASTDYFILQSQNRVKQIDNEISSLNKQQSFLEQMAINGNITAEKSLLQNEKLQQEANKKKADELKKQENLKLASSVFEAYSKNAGDKSIKNPVVKTISDISVLQAFIQSLSTFYEGTETTVGDALGVPHMPGKDGYIVRVDKEEKILNPTLSKMTGNMTTKEIAQIAEDRRMGRLMYQGEGATQLNTNWQTNILVSEIQGLRKAIEDKPVSNVEVSEIIGGVMHIVETTKKGNTTTRNRMRIS